MALEELQEGKTTPFRKEKQDCSGAALENPLHVTRKSTAVPLETWAFPWEWLPRPMNVLGDGVHHSILTCSLAISSCNRHTMPRDRGMPGMYPNTMPLGAYGSPYARPLMGGQQQIPKLLSSKCPLLPASHSRVGLNIISLYLFHLLICA